MFDALTSNYFTVIYKRKDLVNGYLGCTVSSIKPLEGETWTRGSDLPDGPLNDETMKKIVEKMEIYELK